MFANLHFDWNSVITVVILSVMAGLQGASNRKNNNLSTKMDELKANYSYIYSETQPNHGSSMRDAINNISVTVGENRKRLDELKKELEHERVHTEQYRSMLEARVTAIEDCQKRKVGKRGK